MATKMRLQRHGKKGRPFYHIVIADGRAPRDGRFIEKIGYYNPLNVPAEITIDFDRALYWYRTGAQPTATVKSILSYKGVLLKAHLLKGVEKKAITEEMAEARYQAWIADKEARIKAKITEKELAKKEQQKKRHDHESKVNQAKAEAIALKKAKEAAAAAAQEASSEEEVPAAENTETTEATEGETPANE